MKVKLVSSICWNRQHQEAGTALEVSDSDAHWLISRGRAVVWTEANQVDANTREDKPRSIRKKATK